MLQSLSRIIIQMVPELLLFHTNSFQDNSAFSW